MAIKKRYRFLILFLAAAVLVSAGAVAWIHGEWWFPLTESLRRRPSPDLSPADASLFSREWTLDDLSAAENVTGNDLLMLINADHPIPEGYTPELTEYNGAVMNPAMVDDYIRMRDEIQEKTGIRIYVSSDYRTPEDQEQILAESGGGIAALPGCSEHEAGLALDLYAPRFSGMRFLRSAAGRAVNRDCGKYGFIIRYPDKKSDVTGISYEPWHVRYVGAVHAGIMMESGLTLEEYLDLLTPGIWFVSGDYAILRTDAENIRMPEEWISCEISPDNTGCVVLTLRLR